MKRQLHNTCRIVNIECEHGFLLPPVFLCPRLLVSKQHLRSLSTLTRPTGKQKHALTLRRKTHLEHRPIFPKHDTEPGIRSFPLPLSCPGCGALTQTIEPNEAGFYSISRKSVKALRPTTRASDGEDRHHGENQIFESALKHADKEVIDQLGLGYSRSVEDTEPSKLLYPPGTKQYEGTQSPFCDRCHKLLHHSSGVSIQHPSIQSIKNTISESPYNHNHIYHVLDAADFPLSLIPQLHRSLSLTPPRSQNRRSQIEKYHKGRQATLNFVITRSDLLASKQEQVNSLMPYLVQVLRDALGPLGNHVRLGNVRCVSAVRGWWTTPMKEEIWERGGGNWLVGKVNVGKSNLFETVFPKRRNEKVSSSKLRGAAQDEEDRRNDAETGKFPRENFDHRGQRVLEAPDDQGEDVLEGDLLLPPSQPERAFPVMPIISSLPGTTASPIRLPFGHGKGELIDLPGLARGDLDSYIQPEHKLDIVMRNRIKPEQLVLKPGQSLLLGGLIRITPISDGITMLAYTFLPLKVHKTATEKAISIQTQQRESGVDTIMEQGVGQKIKSAGTYQLEWDVTKQRSGPLTASSVVGMKADNLPYRILSTDILIEGCGWVELSAQVRKKKDTQAAVGNEDFPAEAEGKAESQDIVGGLKDVEVVPEVEIFTPEGKYVGSRRPMNAWLFLAEKSPGPKRKGRPRQSMKGQKKANKLARR